MAPGEVVDALLVSLGEDCDGSLGVPEVPNLQFRDAFVIIGDCHLCWDLGVPGKADFAVIERTAILEAEDTLVYFQVPHDGEPVLAGGGEDMLDFAVPSN